jgi:small ligand-binding sensory domain FIST
LLLDGAVRTSGAVGAFLGSDVTVEPVVSQGCRPIGQPLAVTRVENNVIYELAGAPALERLMTLLQTGISPDDAQLIASTSLHIGLLVEEQKATFSSGDFLIRNVLGGNKELGAVIVDDAVELGTVVQFQVRDADSADVDLRELLQARTADAALLFTCNGRGTPMFGAPDHDAGAILDMLGPIPTAGMSAAGEFGPVGARNFLHGFTASIALFRTNLRQ